MAALSAAYMKNVFYTLRRNAWIPLAAAVVSLSALFSAGEPEPLDLSLLQRETLIRNEVESKVKTQILDPVLGEGKASAFADVELEIVSRKADQSRTGIGVSQKYKEKGEGGKKETQYILPGIPKPKSILSGADKPEAAQGQQAQQEKGVQETRYGTDMDIKRFQLTVIHDDTLPKPSLETARQRINDALLPYKVRKKDPPAVIFKPTRFNSKSMLEDLKRPGVYLPLLYAFLSLLLLLFLFGPVASFLRKYVSAILEKPGAEVNVESKLENQEGGGKGGVEDGHQQIDMMFQQKGEEEKTDDEEEDAMKKFEPFSYISEENLKRLVYIFLLRRDEPWVIAVVLSYLKPEFARQALAVLPLELQAKVAMEALTVRQVTREQVEAIDADIKENIDFVVGGVERLTRMIEDSDSGTRQNILEYLKTHKPSVYEKVKRSILTFEDIAHFPDKDMQIIVRGLNTEDMAKALQRAAPEIVNKFFANMSANAANLLKETIDYARDVSTTQIDEARIRVLDAVKALEKEGKIVVREKGSEEASVDDIEMSSERARRRQMSGLAGQPEAANAQPSEAQQPAPGQMQQYLDAGISLYNEGRYEESISYLRYAAEGDPSLWQAYQYLGGAYYAMQQVPEALDCYEKYAQASNDPAVREWVENFKQQAAR